MRELESLLERTLILTDKPTLNADDFAPHLNRQASDESEQLTPLQAALDRYEIQYLHRALEQAGGHKGEAARLLGINPSTLYRKLRKYEI